MLKFIFNRKRLKLNFRLHLAIKANNFSEVEESLRRGADPNEFGMANLRYRPLACAVRYNASPSVIDALIKAGADPQEPYKFEGHEFLLSEAAHLNGRSDEIVQRLQRAEKDAEAEKGPRPLFRGGNVCFRPNFGT